MMLARRSCAEQFDVCAWINPVHGRDWTDHMLLFEYNSAAVAHDLMMLARRSSPVQFDVCACLNPVRGRDWTDHMLLFRYIS
jgi:hypothetical protein